VVAFGYSDSPHFQVLAMLVDVLVHQLDEGKSNEPHIAHFQARLEELFTKITAAAGSSKDQQLWGVLAKFNLSGGRNEKVLPSQTSKFIALY
jgi:hypothetical protein